MNCTDVFIRQTLSSSFSIKQNKLTCDLQLSALNMSKNTKHVNVIVVSRGVILPSAICNEVVLLLKQNLDNLPLSSFLLISLLSQIEKNAYEMERAK